MDMECIAVGFLAGIVVCFAIFIGGMEYERFITRITGRTLPDVDADIYRSRLCNGGDLKSDRLDISTQDREKGKGAEE